MTLTRIAKQKTYTIGRLEIDGVYFCDTLEPAWRDIGWGKPGKKIAGKTAIPEGRYAVAVTFIHFCSMYRCSRASVFMRATRPKIPPDASCRV